MIFNKGYGYGGHGLWGVKPAGTLIHMPLNWAVMAQSSLGEDLDMVWEAGVILRRVMVVYGGYGGGYGGWKSPYKWPYYGSTRWSSPKYLLGYGGQGYGIGGLGFSGKSYAEWKKKK